MSNVGKPNEGEFEVREDEEQGVKLGQIIDLLLAAGYFRVRIKGLSSFDKVVGGMVWCISVCSYDVDVDLLFQENSSIGQKIAMTEKIVGVLKRMKCPHRLEPHQIQGLDFIHIYPVVQWLVKRAIECRAETGDYVRAFSISQFNKNHKLPEDIAFDCQKPRSIEAASAVKNTYRPTRKYRRHDASKLVDEATRVQLTLLEYGRHGWVKLTGDSQTETRDEKSLADHDVQRIDDAEYDEKCIESLMSGMSLASQKEGRLSASGVGSLVGLQSEQIQNIAAHYADKQTELCSVERAAGGVQHHQRMVASLRKQLDQQNAQLDQAKQKHDTVKRSYDEMKTQLQQLQDAGLIHDEELQRLDVLESEADQSVLQQLRSLVAVNETLKKQESEFRESCKQEKERLEANIAEIEKDGSVLQHQEHADMIDQQCKADQEKFNKVRLLLAKRNREIAALQRKIDEMPTRAELSQYQKRFLELYNQVAAKHKETKQFFTMYNTLEDTKVYLEKEVNLLNSINDNFEQAMASSSGREQFLKQFEQIVEGVKQNRTKVERRKQEEKMKRDQLNDMYLEFVEKQRLYFKTVKDFQEECRRNEILQAKLQTLQH